MYGKIYLSQSFTLLQLFLYCLNIKRNNNWSIMKIDIHLFINYFNFNIQLKARNWEKKRKKEIQIS